jgi:hypothetical protein
MGGAEAPATDDDPTIRRPRHEDGDAIRQILETASFVPTGGKEPSATRAAVDRLLERSIRRAFRSGLPFRFGLRL